MRSLTDVINFAKIHPFCYMATMDKMQPRVRPMTLLDVDKGGFYFQTFDSKNMLKQLVENRNVEICFHEFKDDDGGNILRISEEVEFIRNKNLLVKLLKRDPILNYLGYSENSPGFVLFRIVKGNAHFWNMDNFYEKEEMISFEFKQNVEKDERYEK